MLFQMALLILVQASFLLADYKIVKSIEIFRRIYLVLLIASLFVSSQNTGVIFRIAFITQSIEICTAYQIIAFIAATLNSFVFTISQTIFAEVAGN